MGWLREIPIAHRGLHDDAAGAPENSLPAFEAACAAGYAIELDVRASRAGPVCFHDPDLLRLTGARGSVADLRAADLRWTRLAGTREAIPTLAQALDLVRGRVPVLVEIKAAGRTGPLEDAVAEVLGRARGDLAVQSFHLPSLRRLRRALPGLPCGRLVHAAHLTGALGRLRDLWLRLAPAGGVDFVGWQAEGLPSPTAARLRRRGLTLLAWTIRSAGQAARMRPHCDNVIFEGYRPALPDGRRGDRDGGGA